MKYRWFGPPGAETIYPAGKNAGEPLFEGWMEPGKTELDLPEDHPLAEAWKTRGWLVPAAEKSAPNKGRASATPAAEGA